MNTKKFLMVSFCIVFLIISIESAILSMDFFHKECCHIAECPLCQLINISIDFIRNVNMLNYLIFCFMMFMPIIKIIYSKIQRRTRLTLIELNVVQIK